MEEFVESAGSERVEQGELVGVVVVEGGAVDGGGFCDLLDGDFFKFPGPQERLQSLLEKLTGAADARVADFAVGDWRHFFPYPE